MFALFLINHRFLNLFSCIFLYLFTIPLDNIKCFFYILKRLNTILWFIIIILWRLCWALHLILLMMWLIIRNWLRFLFKGIFKSNNSWEYLLFKALILEFLNFFLLFTVFDCLFKFPSCYFPIFYEFLSDLLWIFFIV